MAKSPLRFGPTQPVITGTTFFAVPGETIYVLRFATIENVSGSTQTVVGYANSAVSGNEIFRIQAMPAQSSQQVWFYLPFITDELLIFSATSPNITVTVGVDSLTV